MLLYVKGNLYLAVRHAISLLAALEPVQWPFVANKSQYRILNRDIILFTDHWLVIYLVLRDFFDLML
ncbi:hypothetical protein RGI97_001078 [Serratia marcescens]